jgi:hypothetical protein
LNGTGSVMFEANPGATVNSSDVLFASTTATGDDPEYSLRHCVVSTTDATQTTLCAITISNGRITSLDITITAECESGAGCTAGDGAGYRHQATFRAAAGVATEIAETALAAQEDTSVSTLSIDTAASGATAIIRVTGAANMNLRWVGAVRIHR